MRTSCTYHPTAGLQTSQNYVYSTCNLDVHVTVQQQIFSLQVSVDNVPVVTVLDCRQNLPKLPPGLQLTETPMLCQIVCNQSDRHCKEVINYVRGICRFLCWFQNHRHLKHGLRNNTEKVFLFCWLLVLGQSKKNNPFWLVASLVQIVARSSSIGKCALWTDTVGDLCCFSLETLILTL